LIIQYTSAGISDSSVGPAALGLAGLCGFGIPSVSSTKKGSHEMFLLNQKDKDFN
jgi:hypothetical protein